MTKTEFEAWAQTPEGKAVLQPLLDKRVTEAISTFKVNHPSAEELGPRLTALEQAAEKREAELQRVTLDSALYKRCHENGVPYDLLRTFRSRRKRKSTRKSSFSGRASATCASGSATSFWRRARNPAAAPGRTVRADP